MQEKNNTPKNIVREREREIYIYIYIPFCEGKLCKEWKREWQIYNKMMWIWRDKIKKDEGKDE